MDKCGDFFLKFIQHAACIFQPDSLIFRVHTQFFHLCNTIWTLAVYVEQNINKDSIHIFRPCHLDHILQMFLEKLAVAAV